jgi:hypothetical protein
MGGCDGLRSKGCELAIDKLSMKHDSSRDAIIVPIGTLGLIRSVDEPKSLEYRWLLSLCVMLSSAHDDPSLYTVASSS